MSSIHYSQEERIEADIMNRLSDLKALGFEIEPHQDSDNPTEVFAKPRCTVSYKDSEYSLPLDTSFIRQDETMTWQVTLQARNLRGIKGIYRITTLVAKKLLGFTPGATSPIWIKRRGFVELEKGKWIYYIDICMKRVVVQLEETEIAPLIGEITIDAQ